jgi:fructose-bisphosphate aldolase class II
VDFVSSARIYRHAESEGYVVAGFDSYCLEVIQAHVIAANAENAPFLLQVTPKGFGHIGIEYFTAMARALISNSTVPVAMHLDHGTSLDEIRFCIEKGFTSVMIDGSRLSFDENVEITRRVVKIAHRRDVTVEAELGRVLGKESDIEVKNGEESSTDPDAAMEFVKATGVDSLAVSVGTKHGFYRKEPFIDFERLAAIHERVDVPLVFHGGTGLGPEIIHRASKLGVRKINIGTLIKHAFTSGVKEYTNAHPDEIDPRRVLGHARDNTVKELRAVLRMFGASGKNWLT